MIQISTAAGSADTALSPEADLIGRLGDLSGAYVAVIGGGSLEVMCALIRAGCAAVLEVATTERALIEPVEIAILPHAGSVQAAAQAMPVVLRALLPGGQVVLRDPKCHLARGLRAMLSAHGFSAVRVHGAADGCLVTGARPIFGRTVAGARA